MKKFIILCTAVFLISSDNLYSADGDRSLLEKLFNRDLPGGVAHKKKEKQQNEILSKEVRSAEESYVECKNIDDKSLLEKFLRKDLPGGSGKKEKCIKSSRQAKLNKKNLNNSSSSNKEISFYTGTFDVIDKEGDDKSSLFGVEHKNPDLFRDTFLGKFKPVTGAFMTGNSSVYFYTGVEGQYGIGPIKILPSFAPGYYEKGDGKDLGSVLEFKSEVKFGLDIFENSQLSYSYSHISNNDWGKTNPGTDNQQITFSKNF
ncbi:acyloxyacyl hydrolase [Pelagibacteraceae bacterium]|nr:acyloxyacyl hydrolase [Pelagibacteraceae bacterium]MDC0937549.1 acyloxyacyl hydrolase [Pelagibacteraceae bacterium]